MNEERRNAARDAALTSLQKLNSLGEVIADAVEAALSWSPAPVPYPYVGDLKPSRWGCVCASDDCVIQRVESTKPDASFPIVVTLTCVTHDLVACSLPGRYVDQERLNAQAMLNLDLAHQEQCR